jgi:hypothetical protein
MEMEPRNSAAHSRRTNSRLRANASVFAFLFSSLLFVLSRRARRRLSADSLDYCSDSLQ